MRWRRLRPIPLVVLVLLAGAVMNVAVAWVLVGAPAEWTPGGGTYTGYPEARAAPETKRIQRKSAHLWAPRGQQPPSFVQIKHGLGWTTVNTGSTRGGWWWASCLEAGWPCRCLRADMTGAGTEGPERHSGSVEPPRRFLPNRDWFPYPRDRLPFTPITSGFAINTLLYAVVLALPLSFFPIRRRLRARRRRCPKCGYDLAGLAGAEPGGEGGAPCPECGAAA